MNDPVKPLSPVTAKVVALAARAYPDDLITDVYDAATDTVNRGEVGDTLAEFIAIELSDVSRGHTNPRAAARECADAMDRAMGEVASVAYALRLFAES